MSTPSALAQMSGKPPEEIQELWDNSVAYRRFMTEMLNKRIEGLVRSGEDATTWITMRKLVTDQPLEFK